MRFCLASLVVELRFIHKTLVINRVALNEQLKEKYGHSVAQTAHYGSQ